MEWLSRIIPQSYRLPAEIDLLGFYLTPIFIAVLFGIILAGVSVWLIDRTRLTQFIWHPPLFFFVLTIIYGVLFSILFMPV